MTVDWPRVQERAAREPVRFATAPPFLIDGTLATDVPLDMDAMAAMAQSFRQAGWSYAEQASGLLTTVVRVGETVVPILLGAVATPSLLRIWVSAPALTMPEERTEGLDVSVLYALVVEAFQTDWQSLAPTVADSSREGAWPFLRLGRSNEVPALGENAIELVSLGSGRSLATMGLTLMVPHDKVDPSVGPWMAHSLAHAVAEIVELSRRDAGAWNQSMPGIGVATADELRTAVPGALGSAVDNPPTAEWDQMMLLLEARRHADAGDLTMAESIWSELIRMDCPMSGSATNSWVFTVLNPQERYAEAQAYLMRVVMAGYEFESQNAVSNLAVMMARRGHQWSAVLLHTWLAILNDDRLRDEATYHLANFAAEEGFPSLALTWLERYAPTGLGSYDADIVELGSACRQQVLEGRDLPTSAIFSQVLQGRSLDTTQPTALEQLMGLARADSGRVVEKGDEDPYRKQARVANSARQPLVEMAWLGLSAETAPSRSATDAAERMLEVFSDQADVAVWAVVALAVTRRPGKLEGRMLAALARSAMQLQCRTEAAMLAQWAVVELIEDGNATVNDVITIITALADGLEDSSSEQAMDLLAWLDQINDHRAKQARVRYTPDLRQLEEALRGEDEGLIAEALANRHMPPALLQELAQAADADLAWSLASAANCPAEALHILADHRGESVRRAVAGHANTTEADLDRLSGDAAWSVRDAVRCNPQASDTARATAALLNGT
jgi:hypothetical protein